jgi:hypothetical protein
MHSDQLLTGWVQGRRIAWEHKNIDLSAAKATSLGYQTRLPNNQADRGKSQKHF